MMGRIWAQQTAETDSKFLVNDSQWHASLHTGMASRPCSATLWTMSSTADEMNP